MQEREAVREINTLLDQLLDDPPKTKRELRRRFSVIKRLVASIATPRKDHYILWKMDARFHVLYQQYRRPRQTIAISTPSDFDPVVDAYINFVRRVRQYIVHVFQNPHNSKRQKHS
jgi:hypothetical protein